ncbi:MAG: Fic family protein [Planctomycetes bacterium]|nr:Fic family protein [Planctomycetota bacterium]
MKQEQFTPDAPGRLVPSRAFERRTNQGRLETVPVSTLAFIPDPLPPAVEWGNMYERLLPRLLEAQAAMSRLDGRARGVVEPRLLMGPFWRREARLSSLIEDTVTTPEKLAVAEAGGQLVDADTREVVNYLRAFAHGRRSQLPICSRLIREMHERLLEGVRGGTDKPGFFRTEQNYIGRESMGVAQARFVPPPPGEVLDRCMHEFESFCNRADGSIPDLIAIPLAHYQFECVHPFRDGNGRLGRLLIVLSLHRAGVISEPWIYVSGFLEEHKAHYQDLLLRVSTHGDWQAWLEFMLRCFAESAADASNRVERMLRLRDELRAGVTKARSSALMLRLIDRLFEYPAVTVRQACELLGITHTAVRRHLAKLVDMGVLELVENTGKEQYWIARRILEVSEGQA